MKKVSKIPQAKIVIVGDMGVGKTSITCKYVFDKFHVNQESTLGAAYLEKIQYYSSNNKLIKLQIWDTAGQQKYRAIAKLYYRDCRCAVLVYDMTRQQTFQDIKKWYEQLVKHAPKNIPLFIVGNKIDLLIQQEGDTRQDCKGIRLEKQVNQYAKFINAQHYTSSAKTGEGISKLFNSICQRLGPKIEELEHKKAQQKLKIHKQMTESMQKNSCCIRKKGIQTMKKQIVY